MIYQKKQFASLNHARYLYRAAWSVVGLWAIAASAAALPITDDLAITVSAGYGESCSSDCNDFDTTGASAGGSGAFVITTADSLQSFDLFADSIQAPLTALGDGVANTLVAQGDAAEISGFFYDGGGQTTLTFNNLSTTVPYRVTVGLDFMAQASADFDSWITSSDFTLALNDRPVFLSSFRDVNNVLGQPDQSLVYDRASDEYVVIDSPFVEDSITTTFQIRVAPDSTVQLSASSGFSMDLGGGGGRIDQAFALTLDAVTISAPAGLGLMVLGLTLMGARQPKS